jgi:hypothetical protein
VVVLRVGLEVLGELRDALAEKGDLHFGRTSVAVVLAELPDDVALLVRMKHGSQYLEARRCEPLPPREEHRQIAMPQPCPLRRCWNEW